MTTCQAPASDSRLIDMKQIVSTVAGKNLFGVSRPVGIHGGDYQGQLGIKIVPYIGS